MNKKQKIEKENKFAAAVKFAWGKVKDGFYGLSVLLHRSVFKNRKLKTANSVKLQNTFFVWACLFLPLLIFVVFYFIRGINSILLAFEYYDSETKSFYFLDFPELFANFKKIFKQVSGEYFMITALKNSLILYLFTGIVSFPLHLINSYYVYKKYFGYKTFSVLLFLPTILSSIILTTMFKYMVTLGLPALFGADFPDLIGSLKYGFGTQIAYCIWAGFGSGIVLYVGLMSRIPDQLVEAARLDGITDLKEFWYITLPLVWPTVSLQMAVSIVGIFSGQGALYTFFGASAPTEFQTIGYYLFREVVKTGSSYQYPYASAAGLIFTIIATPLCLGARWGLSKLGSSDVSF